MDGPREGYLLIGVAMFIMIVFLAALLLFMVAYRKRKQEHVKEVERMREKYQKEILETQVEIQKETMQQIGREIHDNVGQKLTLAVLYTEHLNLETEKPYNTEKVSSISGLINESLSDLRSLSQNLTRSSENAAELNILLQKEVVKLNKAGVCAVTFESNGNVFEIPLAINNMLLRIAQEFLQNSLKHSDCKNIQIKSTYDHDGLALSLEDDGTGFEYPATTGGSGIGISNMKKRADLIGAEFILKSSPGKGTSLKIFIPVEKIS